MTTVTLTVGTGTQQWTPPYGCLVIDLVEIWGPGGSGGKRAGRVTGGGSGAYVAIPGPIPVADLVTSGTVPYQTGRGGAAQATATTAGNPGSAKSWFYSSTVFASDLGLGGLASGTSGATAGGAGGLVANCIPTWAAKAGGSGGTDSSASGASSGGASGSASGAGVSGAAISTAVAGGTTTAPSGGGNGGAASITTTSATAGSSPGGGGGAINNASGSSGAGADGAIVITYTPFKAVTQTWNPAHASSVAVFSNSNLTAATGGTSGTYYPFYGTVTRSSGKYYWELTINNLNGANSFGVGIGQTNSPSTTGTYVGSTTDTLGWFPNGVFVNGVSVATWANYGNTASNTLCLALDLDNKKIWGRVGSGNWNNDVIANQNPATNTGGVSLGAALVTSPVPAAVMQGPTDSVTGVFAPSSWANAAPVGFGEWAPPPAGRPQMRRQIHRIVR